MSRLMFITAQRDPVVKLVNRELPADDRGTMGSLG